MSHRGNSLGTEMVVPGFCYACFEYPSFNNVPVIRIHKDHDHMRNRPHHKPVFLHMIFSTIIRVYNPLAKLTAHASEGQFNVVIDRSVYRQQ